MLNLELEHPKAMCRMMDEVRVRNFMNYVNMTTAVDWIVANNKSADLPYHNERHAFGVAASCLDLATCVGREDLIYLVLAALMHDFNHSGGKSKDYENIERALAGLEELAPLIGDAKPHVARLIRTTEYPSTHEADGLLERILRDADLLQGFKPDGVDVIMEGLRLELGVSLGTTPSYMDMYERQRVFLTNVKWNTRAARAQASALMDGTLCGFRSRAELAENKQATDALKDTQTLTHEEQLRGAGYAPGNYFIICRTCNQQAVADKRAWTCLDCATMSLPSQTR